MSSFRRTDSVTSGVETDTLVATSASRTRVHLYLFLNENYFHTLSLSLRVFVFLNVSLLLNCTHFIFLFIFLLLWRRRKICARTAFDIPVNLSAHLSIYSRPFLLRFPSFSPSVYYTHFSALFSSRRCVHKEDIKIQCYVYFSRV